MRRVTSVETMGRSILLAMLAFGAFAPSALAADAEVTFRCCSYAPSAVRILPGDQVTFTGDAGATFADHPLRFDDPFFGQEDAGASASRTFPARGVFTWHCAIHGPSGMTGKVSVTENHLPVADFSASATSVATGTTVSFDADLSSDPDFDKGQTLNYTWDLDGDGIDDPGITSPTPDAVFTNAGTTPRTVNVRLTATDTNSSVDDIGPESTTKTRTITVAPAGGTVPPPPLSGGGPSPGGTAAADTSAPAVTFHTPKKATVASKLRLSFSSTEAGSATATLKAGSKRIGSAKATYAAAGRHALTVKLSKAARRLLRRGRKVTLTLVVADAAGNRRTLKRTLRLKSR
jgi:plastocyanin